MNSAPQLLPEDRPEFERVLDEALHTVASRGAGSGTAPTRLSADQLRVMAMGALTAIAACATEEYQQYIGLREEWRAAGGQAPDSVAESTSGQASGVETRAGTQPTTALGAGAVAVVSALAPVLAGVAAVIFLLLGYSLRVVDPEPALAAPMRAVGWVFALLAVAGALVGMVSLLLMALRNGGIRGPRPRPRGPAGGELSLAEEVGHAQRAWTKALLERGVLPFLHEALADPAAAPDRLPRQSRTARLGYSGPAFAKGKFSSSPSTEARQRERPDEGPRFSSPDYSSPEYGGPEDSSD